MRSRAASTTLVSAVMLTLFVLLSEAAVAQGQDGDFSTQAISTSAHRVAPREVFDDAVEQAPWRLGTIRIAPWMGIRDANTVLRGGDQEEDFTITAGAGLRGYLRNGPKVVWAGHVLPEYTWWADDADRREFNGRYGLGVFAHGNRLEFEVSHRHIEEQAFFSSEFQRLTSTRHDISRIATAIELTPTFGLLLSGQRSALENKDDIDTFSLLDRTDSSGEVLVEYRVGERWRLSAGYQITTSDFDERARNLSNDSQALLVGIGFSGNRVAAQLELADQRYEPQSGSILIEADEVRGSLVAVWEVSPRSFLQTYTRRDFRYALFTDASHILSSRSGLRWQLDQQRFGITLFAEVGEDDYAPISLASERRQDDVLSFGSSLRFTLGRSLRLAINARRLDYDSNLASFDRDLTVVGFSFEILPLQRAIARLTDRLSLGDGTSVW